MKFQKDDNVVLNFTEDKVYRFGYYFENNNELCVIFDSNPFINKAYLVGIQEIKIANGFFPDSNGKRQVYDNGRHIGAQG